MSRGQTNIKFYNLHTSEFQSPELEGNKPIPKLYDVDQGIETVGC